MKRKSYPLFQYQISKRIFNQMLPNLDLIEYHFQADRLNSKEKELMQGTIVDLFFLMKEKTLNYGCIHLQELRNI